VTLDSYYCNLPRIFGPTRKGLAGGWGRLHNEELHNLYASSNIISVIKARRTKWAGHVGRMREMRNEYKISAIKPEGKRPVTRPGRRWAD
jgi:hypothetical protein